MPDWDQDTAFASLQKNREIIIAAAGCNEATTRLRAIDTILFDVLRWDRRDVETERYKRSEGYSDYAFKQGATLCLILEAKKDGVTFVLPAMNVPNRPIGFGVLAAQCTDADSALRQATGYAAAEGARYVSISNGHQWILSLAYVANQPIEERSVLVFKSLDDIESRFNLFWECFSPAGVYSNSVSTLLLESRKAPAPDKLSRRIPTYPSLAERNVHSVELDYATRTLWEELNTTGTSLEFLRECYIRPEADMESLHDAKELLRQRREADSLVIGANQLSSDLPSVMSGYRPDKPIVVLGRIGHGKSTFLKYLRLLEAPEILEGYIQLEVDFLDRPAQPRDVEEYVLRAIEEQLLDSYAIDVFDDSVVRSALRSDLARFRTSPAGKAFAEVPDRFREAELKFITVAVADRYKYLSKVVNDIRNGRRKSLAVFFDNLDRRDDDIQEEAFLRASAIARDWACPVFICLRPGTFWRSKKDGVLDSIAPKVITIASPRVGPLLKRRLEYAAKIARGEVALPGSPRGATESVSVVLPKIALLLDCAADSFSRSGDLRDLLAAFSNGNVRELLRLVRLVLTSGHLDTTKILRSLEGSGYRIAPHEALRALLYGDYRHFDPSSSVVVNLFDVFRSDPAEHFSKVLALQILSVVPDGHPLFGYEATDSLRQQMMQIGFTTEHFRDTMEILFKKECVESHVAGQPWADSPERVRISPLGRYHVDHLLGMFLYYDAVVLDTPILDDRIRATISSEAAIAARLTRADAFINYLACASDAVNDAIGKKFIADRLDRARRDVEAIRATQRTNL
jgi:hypothetical protein